MGREKERRRRRRRSVSRFSLDVAWNIDIIIFLFFFFFVRWERGSRRRSMGYSIKRRMNRFHRIRGIISRLMNETVGANRAEGSGVSDHARNVIPGTSPASSTIKAGREFIDEPLPFFFAEVDRPSFLENPVKTDSAKGYHAANFKQCDYRAVGEQRRG